jgi:hypothetical protein
MHPDQPTTPFELPPTSSRPKRPKLYGPGRPRVLDDAKRREICALIAGGCGLREAASYVDCSITTIRREAERNPDFEQQLRHSEKHAQLNPLRAMQRAVLTHWRAAAWFLERAYPDRFARHEPSAFGIREARALMNELIDTVDIEILDKFRAGRLKKSIHQTFDRYIRTASDRRRNARSFRLTMKSTDRDNQVVDPINELDIPTPDLDALMKLSQQGVENDSTMPHGEVTAELFADSSETSAQMNSFRSGELESLLARVNPLPQLPIESAAANEPLPPQNSNIR